MLLKKIRPYSGGIKKDQREPEMQTIPFIESLGFITDPPILVEYTKMTHSSKKNDETRFFIF